MNSTHAQPTRPEEHDGAPPRRLPALIDRRTLEDVAIAAVCFALVVAFAFGLFWLLPLDFTPPRPS